MYVSRQAKKYFRTCTKCADLDHLPRSQWIIRVCSPLIHSIVSNDTVSGQGRPRSDCADAQSDRRLRCPHMPEILFTWRGPYNEDPYISLFSLYIMENMGFYITWAFHVMTRGQRRPCMVWAIAVRIWTVRTFSRGEADPNMQLGDPFALLGSYVNC